MKIGRIFIGVVVACLVLVNIYLLRTIKQKKESNSKSQVLQEYEYLYKASIHRTAARLQYEQYPLATKNLYVGIDSTKLFTLESLPKSPKLVFGLSQDMCSPCIYAVLDQLAAIFPDYKDNENILFVADVEQRLKEKYLDKRITSFYPKKDFQLYELGAPYLFILDEDLAVKMLYITDKNNPGLTKIYLESIKKLIQ